MTLMGTKFFSTIAVLLNLLIFTFSAFSQDSPQQNIKGIMSTGAIYPNATVPEASVKFDEATGLLDAGDYAAALASFQATSKLDPGYVKAVDMIAVSFRRLGQLDSAEHYYLKSMEMFPEGGFAVGNLGVVYLMQEKYEQAVECYEKQISLNPSDPEGYYGLGNALLQAQKFEEAETQIRKAVTMYEQSDNPHLSDGYLQLAISLIYQEKNKAAMDEINRAIALGRPLPGFLQEWVDGQAKAEPKSYSAEELEAMEPLVINACDLLLSTSPTENEDERKRAAGNTIKWVSETSTMTLAITEELVPFVGDADLLTTFIAAFAKTGIEGGPKLSQLDHYRIALRSVADYYKAYSKDIAKNEAAEKFAKMSDKQLKSYVKKNL